MVSRLAAKDHMREAQSTFLDASSHLYKRQLTLGEDHKFCGVAAHKLAHLPTCSLICLLACSFVRLLAHLPTHSLICPLACSFAHLVAHVPAHSLICPLARFFAHSLANLPSPSLNCSLICHLAHSVNKAGYTAQDAPDMRTFHHRK